MDMPEEAIEAPEQETPEQDQPTEPTSSPEPEASDQPDGGDNEPESSFLTSFDPSDLPEELQVRYQQMHADYTRKTQEVARLRKEAEQAIAVHEALLDPELAPEVLAALGYQLDAEDEDYEDIQDPYVDPAYEEVRQEVGDIRQILAQQAEDGYMAREIAQIESQINRKLDQDELNLVAQLAQSNRMPDGTPDVQTAWATIQGIVAAERQRWVSKKRNIPRSPGRGSEADERVDLSDPEVRRQRMEQVVARELESAS